jgi:RNA recognition motif-containing protein
MKLYVGNLPYNTTEEQLRELFGAYGAPSSVSIVVDRYSGRSRGFGFVEFADSGEAQAAIEALNGKEFGGRTLTVNEARSDRGGRGDRGGPRRGPGGGRDWS